MISENCPVCSCQNDAPNSPRGVFSYKAQVLFLNQLKIPPGLTRYLYAHRHRATQHQGKLQNISSIFLLTALYAKTTAHFWQNLYKCGALFSHLYLHCGKS